MKSSSTGVTECIQASSVFGVSQKCRSLIILHQARASSKSRLCSAHPFHSGDSIDDSRLSFSCVCLVNWFDLGRNLLRRRLARLRITTLGTKISSIFRLYLGSSLLSRGLALLRSRRWSDSVRVRVDSFVLDALLRDSSTFLGSWRGRGARCNACTCCVRLGQQGRGKRRH